MDASALHNQQQLVRARQRFLDGAPLPDGLLPAPVSRSWSRSRDAGLLPEQACFATLEPELPALDHRDQQLADCVAPEIDRLWQQIGGSSWTLYCVNAAGVIVYGRQPGDRDNPLRQLRTGRRIHEQSFGTTAPVCTLAEGVPIVLVGSQHYLTEFQHFFCVSVPLRGVHGELLGAVDFTGIGKRNANAILEQLSHAAVAAENRLYAGLGDCRIISLQHDPRLLHTPLQGLLAIDATGHVQAANPAARRLLGLGSMSQALALENLFDKPPGHATPTPQLLTLTDGSRLYAQVMPAGTAKARNNSRPALPSIEPSPATPLGGDTILNKQFQAAKKAFAAGVPILLQGETGTGKEVFARALHDSFKPGEPFIAINCSAIPESLIEAELFGYVEGTFTGARKGGAQGLLQAANGGTLLLDEIGDMPPALQTRLLRVLQERQVTRLGDSRATPLDVRVISASHCRLQELIARHLFREDLYYRLNGLQVRLPALRERTDMHLLIERLLQRYSAPPLHPDSHRLLMAQHWAGNIRQLEQTLRLAAALAADEPWVQPEHLGLQAQPAEYGGRLQQAMLGTIQATLQAHGGNVTATASALGISRTTLYKKLRENVT